MCYELERLSYGFTYDPDDSDGGIFIGNRDYIRFKAIVGHVANCSLCRSAGWRSYEGPHNPHARDGKLWYGNVYRDEMIADRYFWLLGIDLENGRRLPSSHRGGIGLKMGSPSEQGADVFNRTGAEHKVTMHAILAQLNMNARAYRKSRGRK